MTKFELSSTQQQKLDDLTGVLRNAQREVDNQIAAITTAIDGTNAAIAGYNEALAKVKEMTTSFAEEQQRKLDGLEEGDPQIGDEDIASWIAEWRDIDLTPLDEVPGDALSEIDELNPDLNHAERLDDLPGNP